MISTKSYPTKANEKNIEADEIQYDWYVDKKNELPIRLSRRIKELEQLPIDLGSSHEILKCGT